MLKTNKFSQKTVTDGAVKAVSVVTGMMLGGAVQNVMPANLQNSSDAILSVAGGTGAVVLKDGNTMSTVAKYASLGVASRSLYSLLTNQIRKQVPSNDGEELSMVDKLVQGAVGLSSPEYAGYLASPTIDFDEYDVYESESEQNASNGISMLG